MQSERWQSCTEIFNAAVERPHNARDALLDRTCNGDEALRRKVELLLKYHDKSGDFIDTPAFLVAPELLIDDPNARVGQHVGSYRIEAILGVGGMGVVYRAFDERLGRKVGLKVLPQTLLADEEHWERAKREARTASALNHPNIMTIHEVGEVDSTHYIATEFIEGTTLRERMTIGPIPTNEALDIAMQVASALCVAQDAGIVHRDIKPENIMLRPDGYVKVLDFGIAKFSEPATSATRRSADVQTVQLQGQILGTTRYMSPEQARGAAVDARSDLWSLGVVLYEMVAGRPPFAGETPTDVIASISLEQPQVLGQAATTAHRALQTVLEKSMQKDPAERYQSAEAMLSELRAIREETDNPVPRARWIGVAAAVVGLLVCFSAYYAWRNQPPDGPDTLIPIEKGIAVLPFENLSTEKDDLFFTNGFQDDVLTSLGKIKELKVIARASVADYREARLAGSVREIGRNLGVSHVLEGSVRKVSDRVVINVALIDTREERHVWSERYERTLTDTISLQGELAIEIARALQTTLTPAEARVAAAKATQNPEAYLAYLRAREVEIAYWSSEELEGAIELYQKAVDLDPQFALARARLSLTASQLFVDTEVPTWKIRARGEAEEALRLQPQLGEAHLALTHCYLWGDRAYDRALEELTRTTELLPNSAEVPLTAAFIYKRQNRFSERLAALRRAEVLDPRNRRVLFTLTSTFRWVRDWPEALHTYDRVAAVAPDESIHDRWWRRANDEFRLSGEIDTLKRAIKKEADRGTPDGSSSLDEARYETAVLDRNYTEAARHLPAIPEKAFSEAACQGEGHSRTFHQALLAVASNADATAKQQALEVARDETQTRLTSGRYADEKARADMALLDAFLGRKEEAIREALTAVEPTLMTPIGSMEFNDRSSALAMVYAHTGEAEKAIDLIEHLLTVPTELQRGAVYNMTLTDLKWRWQWDPLRSHPRFQKLLAGPEPRTVY